MPWACRTEQGTEMKIDGSLEELVVRTSICNHPLLISENLDFSIQMPYPVIWNSFRVWNIIVALSNSHLQYIADHIVLLSQLGAHWSQGDPIQRLDFVPYDIKINVELKNSFDLRLIASPNNSFHVAGKSMGYALDPGTPLVILQGSSLNAAISIPLSKFLRPEMSIFYHVKIDDTSFSLIPGAGSVLEATLSNEMHEFITGASLELKGVYSYFYEFNPDSRDVFTMNVQCIGARVIVQPFYLSALNLISKNYFGADKRAMAPKVLASRGGVNHAELEVQQESRRAKGDHLNQSDSYLTVHMRDTELLLPQSWLCDKEFATASIPSLVIEMHSSYHKSSFSDLVIDCAPLIISFPRAPIESTAVSSNPLFPENGVGNIVLEGLYFKSSSLFGPKPEFNCYCSSKEIVVSSVYGTLLPLQLLHLVKVFQNLLGDWSFGTDMNVSPNHEMNRKQLNSTFVHLKSINLTVLFSPFSSIVNASNITYDSSNDLLDSFGPQSVWSVPDVNVRLFLHSLDSDFPKSESSSPPHHSSSAALRSLRSAADVHAFEMLYLSAPLSYSSSIVRSCIDVDAAVQREFWSEQDRESGRLQFNDDDATKSSPRSAASNTASTAGGTSTASSRVRRRSIGTFPKTPGFADIAAAGASVVDTAAASTVVNPLISEDAWYALTSETPRGDASNGLKANAAEENMFDVNDFESAHSSVSTPNDDDLHSARSLSSDGGNSRIVLNDVDIGSSFSTPRELHIDDDFNDKGLMHLHLSTTLHWREHLNLCGRVGQSLHPGAVTGPILEFPTWHSSHFESENVADKRFATTSDQLRESAAGVGDFKVFTVDSNSTTSDCDGNNSEEHADWEHYKTLTQAEFDEGDKRSCLYSNSVSFAKGICCRVNAMAPSALEVIAEYILPFKLNTASVAEMQLPLPTLNGGSPSRLGPLHSSPESPNPSTSESVHALISLFEYAHQAVRTVAFSSPDAMLLKHTLKRLLSVTVSFIVIDIYPPPPITKGASWSSVVNRNRPSFDAVRFLAASFKYKSASQTHVSCNLRNISDSFFLTLRSFSGSQSGVKQEDWRCCSSAFTVAFSR